MKGQFFILGAVVIISLLFTGLPLFNPIFETHADDLPLWSENLKREYPTAFNIALNTSNSSTVLPLFTDTWNQTMYFRDIQFETLWVHFYNATGDQGIIIGNQLSNQTTVNITFLWGTDLMVRSIAIDIGKNETVSTTDSLINNEYNLSLTFGNYQSGSRQLSKGKNNLFVYYILKRGDNSIVEELFA